MNNVKMKASFSAPLFASILYLLILASDFLKDRLISDSGNDYLSVIIIQLLIFAIPSIVFCRMKGVGYSSKLNMRLISPGKLGCVITSSLALIFGSIMIRLAQIYIFGVEKFSHSVFESYIGSDTPYNFLFTVAAFAVIPALTEEFAFRCIMLTEYNEGGYGALNATIITSLLSAMLFFSLESFPVRFFSSIVFCMLTYVTGSSLSAFICHLLFNIYTVLGEKYIIKALSDPSNRIISVFTFILMFLILCVIMFGEFEHTLRQAGKAGVPSPSYLLKKTEDGKTPDISATESEESDRPSKKVISNKTKLTIEVFFSPSFLACVLIFAIALIGLL